MSLLVENRFGVFLVLTVIIGGGAAFLAGRALASGWRPLWEAMLFMLPLGLAVRFLHFALFQANLLSIHYFITDMAILLAAGFMGYRLTMASQMVRQYPWLYERSGPLNWRSKP